MLSRMGNTFKRGFMKLYDLNKDQIEDIEHTIKWEPVICLDGLWKKFAKDMKFKYETICFVHNNSNCDPLEYYMFWAEPE